LDPVGYELCTPEGDKGGGVRATRGFQVGETVMITFDYAMRNYSIEHFPGGCLCGADICRGSVTGWKDLPADRKAAYDGLVAPYLLEIDRELIGSIA
jgi:uncharacterized protein